ncbi:MAG TPA: ABC transporter ATP-binding protein [Desulfobacteraceae bacterium]|nr:ABC transporter ATP-binding protein [Desulfobacteraceae bacterium]
MNSQAPDKAGHALLLQAEDIHKSFGHDGITVEVLRGVDMTVDRGEMIAVVGASGSGKTTLLQILGTLAEPTGGRLTYEGRDLTACGEQELSRHRNRNIGFIFQFHHLLPEFTSLENVMMPGLINGMNLGELEERALHLLDQVNLLHRKTHRSGELSGGEQQRVALARALIMQPSLLLADEPTGNLDSQNGRLVFDLLHSLSRSLSLAVVMVTHNEELARAMDRRLTLKDGVLSA